MEISYKDGKCYLTWEPGEITSFSLIKEKKSIIWNKEGHELKRIYLARKKTRSILLPKGAAYLLQRWCPGYTLHKLFLSMSLPSIEPITLIPEQLKKLDILEKLDIPCLIRQYILHDLSLIPL